MLNRTTLLATLDDAYARRANGDKAGLDSFWAPGATFQLIGGASIAATISGGRGSAAPAVDRLIDMVRFHSFERIDALVEGHRAAVRWKVIASGQAGVPVEAELFDLWTFDEHYRATSLVQFTDTALLASILN